MGESWSKMALAGRRERRVLADWMYSVGEKAQRRRVGYMINVGEEVMGMRERGGAEVDGDWIDKTGGD